MKNINLMNLTMSQITTFCAAAKFENFSSAASFLNITQPMVSRNIGQLENELGVELFIREKQRVYLTAAGHALAASWNNLTEKIETSIQNASVINSNIVTSFSLCDDRGTDKNRYLYPILARFAEAHPEININIEQTDAAWTVNSLYADSTDAAFLMLHETTDIDKNLVEWKVLYKTSWGAYIHRSNPLFQRDSISFSDLENEPIILLSPTASRNYVSTVIDMFKEHNISPYIHSHVSNNGSLSFALHQGNGIVMANEFLQVPSPDICKFFPLKGTTDGLAIAWRKNTRNSLVREFVDISEKFFTQEYVPKA